MGPTSSRSKPSRSRDPVRTKAAIQRAAQEVFVEHGFTGARTSEIARRADVPQGLIYHYFSGKEELFDAVMEAVFAPYFAGMLDMLSAPRDPGIDLLERSVRTYFEFLRDNPEVPRLMAWWLADQGWMEKPLVGKKGAADAVHALGAERIRAAQEAGLIRRDLDPSLVIKTFIDMCMMWHMSKGDEAFRCSLAASSVEDEGEIDAVYLEHMIEVFLRGIVSDEVRRP